MVVLAIAGVAGAVAYQAAARDRDYRALLARGDSALRGEQTFGAVEAFSGAIALRPDSMLAHLRRGETYQRRGDLEAAARDFRTAAALDRRPRVRSTNWAMCDRLHVFHRRRDTKGLSSTIARRS
jgi:Flp pilus assembly protein TadD